MLDKWFPLLIIILNNKTLSLSLSLYIYIYIERERERTRWIVITCILINILSLPAREACSETRSWAWAVSWSTMWSRKQIPY